MISFILLLFIGGIEAIRGWRNWIREDPLVHPYKWLRPDLVPPAPFLQCEPRLSPGGSGVLSDPSRIDEEFRKAWLPYFCRSGQREASLEEFDSEVEGWLPLLPEVSLPCLTGQMLADVVRGKGATAGSLDGWGWRELKVLPVSWYDGLARILTAVEDTSIYIPPWAGGDSQPVSCTRIANVCPPARTTPRQSAPSARLTMTNSNPGTATNCSAVCGAWREERCETV